MHILSEKSDVVCLGKKKGEVGEVVRETKEGKGEHTS
jgi:hypothetical protein